MTFDLAHMRSPVAATSDEDAQQGVDPAARQALADWLTRYLRNQYRVAESRYFVGGPDTKWVAVEALAREQIEAAGGRRELQAWHNPGYDLVATWKLGEGETTATLVAVAMAYDRLPDGGRVIGYFTLTPAGG